jgi:hypothetical protein
MHARRINRGRATRGGALIIVLLVVLVLTIVGLAVAYFTQLEDQTSGNIRLAKTAFYAAESGLRTGEKELDQANSEGVPVTELLQGTGTQISLPGGGAAGVPLEIRGDLYFKVVLRAAAGTSDVSTFSLYVRNNVEDPGNTAEDPGPPVVVRPIDTDRILNLISVGQVWSVAGVDGAGLPIPGRLLATKILEEQVRMGRPGESVAPQEGVNESGTNTGQLGENP